MAQVLTFPAKRPAQGNQQKDPPNYTGRLLALNIEKAARFQCGGFFVSSNCISQLVPAHANMTALHRAVASGVLLDITDNQALETEFTRLDRVTDSDTGKKVYTVKVKLLRQAGITQASEKRKGSEDFVYGEDEVVCYMTGDGEEQRRIEEQLRAGSLDVPPGMDDPEKYVIRIDRS